MSHSRGPCRCGCWLSVLVVAVVPAVARAAFEDPSDRPAGYREDDVPTAARRAARWHPAPGSSDAGAWFASASVGPAWFSGDRIDEGPDFFAQFRFGRELTREVYLVGSYGIGFVTTDVRTPDGSRDEETHDLHAVTGGFGVRLELAPEFEVFVEPRVGMVFGSDAHLGPAGGGTAGLSLQAAEGLYLRLELTGLVADTSLDTRGRNADLDALWSVGLGLQFEF